MKLTTSSVFENLTIPITDQEENDLAISLIRDGCREPIAVWNGIILDGHKRYQICTLEQIDFTVQNMDCETEEEAIAWVCRRRAAGLPINSQAYRYLIGKWYQSEVIINRAVRKPRIEIEGYNYDKSKHRTSFQMSRELGCHQSTLEKYGSYATAMDVLIKTEPAILKVTMSGDVFLSMDNAIVLSHMEEKTRKDEIRKLLRTASKKAQAKYLKEDRRAMRQAEEANQIPLSIGIKDMPAFNPDMELQGLTLTMPTWIHAMERAVSRSDLSLVTDGAKENLLAVLDKMEDEIKAIREVLQ